MTEPAGSDWNRPMNRPAALAAAALSIWRALLTTSSYMRFAWRDEQRRG